MTLINNYDNPYMKMIGRVLYLNVWSFIIGIRDHQENNKLVLEMILQISES